MVFLAHRPMRKAKHFWWDALATKGQSTTDKRHSTGATHSRHSVLACQLEIQWRKLKAPSTSEEE